MWMFRYVLIRESQVISSFSKQLGIDQNQIFSSLYPIVNTVLLFTFFTGLILKYLSLSHSFFKAFAVHLYNKIFRNDPIL